MIIKRRMLLLLNRNEPVQSDTRLFFSNTKIEGTFYKKKTTRNLFRDHRESNLFFVLFALQGEQLATIVNNQNNNVTGTQPQMKSFLLSRGRCSQCALEIHCLTAQ